MCLQLRKGLRQRFTNYCTPTLKQASWRTPNSSRPTILPLNRDRNMTAQLVQPIDSINFEYFSTVQHCSREYSTAGTAGLTVLGERVSIKSEHPSIGSHRNQLFGYGLYPGPQSQQVSLEEQRMHPSKVHTWQWLVTSFRRQFRSRLHWKQEQRVEQLRHPSKVHTSHSSVVRLTQKLPASLHRTQLQREEQSRHQGSEQGVQTQKTAMEVLQESKQQSALSLQFRHVKPSIVQLTHCIKLVVQGVHWVPTGQNPQLHSKQVEEVELEMQSVHYTSRLEHGRQVQEVELRQQPCWQIQVPLNSYQKSPVSQAQHTFPLVQHYVQPEMDKLQGAQVSLIGQYPTTQSRHAGMPRAEVQRRHSGSRNEHSAHWVVEFQQNPIVHVQVLFCRTQFPISWHSKQSPAAEQFRHAVCTKLQEMHCKDEAQQAG